MANVRGRPIAPLILSSDERAYLERQVRRHRAARSSSERCRVILRCADGVPSKTVASELGLHEHTVGKWRRRFLKDRIDGLSDEARAGRLRTIDVGVVDQSGRALVYRAHPQANSSPLEDRVMEAKKQLRHFYFAAADLRRRADQPQHRWRGHHRDTRTGAVARGSWR